MSLGGSALLIGSLLATVAAPAAFAANTASGGGTIVPGQGSSPAGSLTFAEDAVAQYSDGSFVVTVTDYAGTANVAFDTSVTPTVTRNFGVGAATVGFVGSPATLVVNVSGTDATKIDSFTIGNLKVKASRLNRKPVVR